MKERNEELSKEKQFVSFPIFQARDFVPDNTSVFVLMPFSEPWSDKIWETIQRIVEEQGLKAERADNKHGHIITEDIWKGIVEARIIIADVTALNPNVFYELGISHTVGRDIILITQSSEKFPFDTQGYRHIIYSNDSAGIKVLEKEIPLKIEHYMKNPKLTFDNNQLNHITTNSSKKFTLQLDENFKFLQSEVILQDIFTQIADLREKGSDYILEYNIQTLSEQYNRHQYLCEKENLSENDVKTKLELRDVLKKTFFFQVATLYDYFDFVITTIIDYQFNSKWKTISDSQKLVVAIQNSFSLFSKNPIKFDRRNRVFAVITKDREYQFKIGVLQTDIDRWFKNWDLPYNEQYLIKPDKDIYDLSDYDIRMHEEYIPLQIHLFVTKCFQKKDENEFKQRFFNWANWLLESRAS
jgi:hypothetical protein